MLLENALLWLTLAVYHESRGEPPKAQMAVAHVVLNRVKEEDVPVHVVINRKKQFPWVKSYHKKKVKPWSSDPKVFAQCGQSVLRAVVSPDFTGGATHFHKIGAGDPWAKKLKQTGRYGKLATYKEKK